MPADALEKILDFVGHAPPAMKASMALDLERGNRLELPWLGGKVVELGRQLKMPTPVAWHDVCGAEAVHHGGACLRRHIPPRRRMERRMGLEITPASDADYDIVHNLARFYIYDISEHAGLNFPADGLFRL